MMKDGHQLEHDWQHDDHQDHRKDEERQWPYHFDGQLIRRLLRPQHPPVSHFLAENPERIRDIAAKFKGMAEHGDEGGSFIDGKAIRERIQRFHRASAGAFFGAHDLQVHAKRRTSFSQLASKPLKSRINAQAGADAYNQKIEHVREYLTILDRQTPLSPRQVSVWAQNADSRRSSENDHLHRQRQCRSKYKNRRVDNAGKQDDRAK